QPDACPPGQPGGICCPSWQYEREGGCTLPVGRDGVTITVSVPGDESAPDHLSASVVRVEPVPPVVTYEPAVHARLRWARRGWRRWTATVTFVSDVTCQLPPTNAVFGTGPYMPQSAKDGEPHLIPGQSLVAGQPTTHTFDLDPCRGTCWLVCLLAD